MNIIPNVLELNDQYNELQQQYIELQFKNQSLIESNKQQETLMGKLESQIIKERFDNKEKFNNFESIVKQQQTTISELKEELISKHDEIYNLEQKLNKIVFDYKRSLQDMKHFYHNEKKSDKQVFFEHEVHYIVAECFEQMTSGEPFNLPDVIETNINNWTPDKLLEIASKRETFHVKYREAKYQKYRTEKIEMNEKQLALHKVFLPQYYPFKLIPIDDDGNDMVIEEVKK